jgi:cytochrome c
VGILDQDQPVIGFDDLGEKGVGQGGSAGGCASCNKDVAPFRNSGAKCHRLAGRHDAGGGIIIQRENGDGRAFSWFWGDDPWRLNAGMSTIRSFFNYKSSRAICVLPRCLGNAQSAGH